MGGRPKHFTVMIIPHDRGRTYALSIHAGVLRTLAALLVLFVIGVAILVYRSGAIGLKLQLVEYLRAENAKLRTESKNLQDVRSAVARLEKMNAYLEGVALRTDSSTALPAIDGVQFAQARESVATLGDIDLGPLPRDSLLAVGRRLNYTEQMLQSIPYIRPVQGWVTRNYSENPRDTQHHGIDFAASLGTPIRATAPGIVEDVRVDEFLGHTLQIKHRYGFTTVYAHCSQILVVPGQHVQRGQTVAMVGNTGLSTAPHLHYEVLKNAKQVNPLRYMVD